jgi:hypothetical protein
MLQETWIALLLYSLGLSIYIFANQTDTNDIISNILIFIGFVMAIIN